MVEVMKIVLLQLIGSGGTQLYVSQLANSLAETDNEVSLFLGNHLYNEKYYSNSKAKIIFIDTQSSYFNMFLKLVNPYSYYKILKLIEQEKPRVVHLVFEDLISGIILCVLKIKGYKLILTEHNPSPHLGEKLIVKMNQESTKFILRKIVNKIIVHGDNIKNQLITKGVMESKISVVPHGDFLYYLKWAKNIPVETSILFFGSIQEYKGLEYLIKAAPLIAIHIPDFKIIIAGKGDFSQYEHLIKDRSYFEIHNEHIPDEDVACFFERAKLVVLPYIDGSQSGVIPIAYAFKKPVIVTNVGSIAEAVDDNETGFVIPPRDSEALASSVVKLLKNDSSRKSMGEKGYEKMIDEFSWAKVSNKVLQVYDELL